LTKWFRTGHKRTKFLKDAGEYVPALTQSGFEKQLVPKDLFRAIRKWYRQHRDDEVYEKWALHTVKSDRPGERASFMLQLPDEIKKEIHKTVRPLVERWAGLRVRPTYVYGIRVYHRFAKLKPHRDRVSTHVIGVIINVDQKTSRPWPLQIQDNFYRNHDVYLRPGEMLMYEGARLLHSRLTPFRGHVFANIFCHFVPA
jgi:prolyl 4-hydroxylase